MKIHRGQEGGSQSGKYKSIHKIQILIKISQFYFVIYACLTEMYIKIDFKAVLTLWLRLYFRDLYLPNNNNNNNKRGVPSLSSQVF